MRMSFDAKGGNASWGKLPPSKRQRVSSSEHGKINVHGGTRGPAFFGGSAHAGGRRGGAKGGGGGVAEEDDACWRTTGSQYIGQPVAIELNDAVFAGTVRDVCVCVCACACVLYVCLTLSLALSISTHRERERERTM
jgi:hypothetical protein